MASRRRPTPAVYWRRRLVALTAIVIAAAVVARVLGADDHGAGRGELAGSEAEGAPAGAEQPRRLTVSASGDLLIHSPVFNAAAAGPGGAGFDFTPMLKPIRRYVRGADLALCHAETVIGFGPPQGYPLFSAPAELAEAIARTGWDACDTASNHTLDYGQEGVEATLRVLDRAGVRHTGSYSSRRASRQALILEAEGVEVALLAYTTDTNGIPLPTPWSVNIYDRDRALADAREARAAGADVVIVNVAWGSELVPEYVSEPSERQRREAERLAESPAITAVLGSGPHVVQPIRVHRGTPIVYSEGNLISNQTAACCAAASQDGLIALLDIETDGERDRVRRIRYVPTWVRHPDFAVLPVGQALRDGAADQASLRASWERTVGVVGRSGKLEPVPRSLG